jgi:heme-degrading monooxygenase HmoA
MIVRIVKMVFVPERVPDFLALFEERKTLIRGFEGCKHLELWNETGKEHIFFTYSHWESESALDHYRFSELFKDTWTKTKALFQEKAAAWSVEQRQILP